MMRHLMREMQEEPRSLHEMLLHTNACDAYQTPKTKECRDLSSDQASSHHAKDHKSCTFTKSLISHIQDIVKSSMRSPCSSISIVRKRGSSSANHSTRNQPGVHVWVSYFVRFEPSALALRVSSSGGMNGSASADTT
jgi:hypothetical protein